MNLCGPCENSSTFLKLYFTLTWYWAQLSLNGSWEDIIMSWTNLSRGYLTPAGPAESHLTLTYDPDSFLNQVPDCFIQKMSKRKKRLLLLQKFSCF